MQGIIHNAPDRRVGLHNDREKEITIGQERLESWDQNLPRCLRRKLTLGGNNMIKRVKFLLGLLFIVGGAVAGDIMHNYKPPACYVPDENTAIQIAVAIWGPIYGADKIAREKPYNARLENGIWIVQGSIPKDMLGGVAIAEISKEDGRVIRVSHGQ